MCVQPLKIFLKVHQQRCAVLIRPRGPQLTQNFVQGGRNLKISSDFEI